MTGDGSVTAVPDQAEFDFTVDTRAATAKAALTQNATAAAAVVAAVKNAGVADADIQTSEVSLSPQTNQDGTQIIGYSASNSISVKSTIPKAGSIVDAAVGAGADGVSGPSLSLSDQDAQYRDALKKAVAAAHAKAQTLADAGGLTLGGVQTIVEGAGAIPGAPCAEGRHSRRCRDSAGHADGRCDRHGHVQRVLATALERKASLRPLAPRAGIEPPFPAVERRAMKHDARRDAGAAVGDEVAFRKLGLRLRPTEHSSAPGMRPGGSSIGFGSPRHRAAGRASTSRSVGSARRRASSSAETVSPERSTGVNSAGFDRLFARVKRAAPDVETADQHCAVVMAEVPEEPPEPLGAAKHPVGDDEHPGPDARTRGRSGKRRRRRQRMPTRIRHREIRQVFVHVEERGAGNMPGEVELPPPAWRTELPAAVDELCPHRLRA